LFHIGAYAVCCGSPVMVPAASTWTRTWSAQSWQTKSTCRASRAFLWSSFMGRTARASPQRAQRRTTGAREWMRLRLRVANELSSSYQEIGGRTWPRQGAPRRLFLRPALTRLAVGFGRSKLPYPLDQWDSPRKWVPRSRIEIQRGSASDHNGTRCSPFCTERAGQI
jgi:hypothetical protein